MLGRKNSVQGPLLLKLLVVGLKTMSHLSQPNPPHINIHCVPFKVSIMCSYHFQTGNLVMLLCRNIARMVRLSFHDAVGSRGLDGCIDARNKDNVG